MLCPVEFGLQYLVFIYSYLFCTTTSAFGTCIQRYVTDKYICINSHDYESSNFNYLVVRHLNIDTVKERDARLALLSALPF